MALLHGFCLLAADMQADQPGLAQNSFNRITRAVNGEADHR